LRELPKICRSSCFTITTSLGSIQGIGTPATGPIKSRRERAFFASRRALTLRQNLARRNSLRAVANRGRCEASGEEVEPAIPLDAADDAKI